MMAEKIPRAAELLPDILLMTSDRPFSKTLIPAVAEMHGFPRDMLDVANPPGTNCTFRAKADAAMAYLHRSGLVVRDGKKGPLIITDDGFDFLRELTPKAIRKLSAEIEPKIKRIKGKTKPTPKKPVITPQQPQQRDVTKTPAVRSLEDRIEEAKRLADGRPTPGQRATRRAAKAAANFHDMPLDKLHIVWTNAQDKLSHPKEELRLAAKEVLTAIENERERRRPNASSPLPGGGYFRWPTTVAESGKGQLSFEADAFGVLAETGYRVGRTRGEPETARRRTLARLFMVEVLDAPTSLEWAAPGTDGRLRKMAYTIAALTRNAKRRGILMEYAVADWESDLNYLHDTYYVGRFDFPWPETGAGGITRSGR
ncbi:hypothetical protein [Mesorhizobium sp. M0488]|uniref:hypothetical protein n=1 Tax=unclassified Mesorhizobium TaxID=325217 RepID=UPI003338BDA0